MQIIGSQLVDLPSYLSHTRRAYKPLIAVESPEKTNLDGILYSDIQQLAKHAPPKEGAFWQSRAACCGMVSRFVMFCAVYRLMLVQFPMCVQGIVDQSM